MGNLFSDLPLPVGVGPGASVDTSAMGAVKTITANGVWTGLLTVEVSNDGGTDYVPLVSFDKPGKKTIAVAAQFMRTRVETGGAPGTANVDVGANDGGMLQVNLPVPAGDGTGAAVDVSALGTLNTIIATGDFTGQLDVQISEDNVSWESCAVITQADGLWTKEFVAQFMRVVRSQTSTILPPGTGQVDVGAANDAVTAASLGSKEVFRITAAGGEGSDFNVTLPTPRASDAYEVFASLVGAPAIYSMRMPDALAGDRTTTQFRVITTAALTAGDVISFLVVDRA